MYIILFIITIFAVGGARRYYLFMLFVIFSSAISAPKHVSGPRGPFRTKNHKIPPKIFRTKIVHTSGTFFQNITFFQLHIYRKRHIIRITYSKYLFIIQNTPTEPKYFRTSPMFFEHIENVRTGKTFPTVSKKHQTIYFIICINSIIHIL